MPYSDLDKAVNELFELTPTKSAQEIGATFVEFLLEAQHGSWDGVPARDKASMGRFIRDFTTYLKHSRVDPVVFTGSRYLTSDR